MRVVEPADVAALAVHIMINTALTGVGSLPRGLTNNNREPYRRRKC
jgi:hypothetical protein